MSKALPEENQDDTQYLEEMPPHMKRRYMKGFALQSPDVFAEYVSTKDERDKDDPVKPFPFEKPDLKVLYGAIERHNILFVPKSRQVMLTWKMCIYCTWLAKAFPHRMIYVQSQNLLSAGKLVFNGGISQNWDTARISFIEAHLPRWLKDNPTPTSDPPRLVYPNGSIIEGIAQGGDKIRSQVPSFVFSDEAAFQPEFADAYTAMLPLCRGGAKLVAVSSAGPGFFAMVARG